MALIPAYLCLTDAMVSQGAGASSQTGQKMEAGCLREQPQGVVPFKWRKSFFAADPPIRYVVVLVMDLQLHSPARGRQRKSLQRVRNGTDACSTCVAEREEATGYRPRMIARASLGGRHRWE
jgi:hypothetical protein